jgi:hypothetical protein
MCFVIDNIPVFPLRSASLELVEALHSLSLYAEFQQLTTQPPMGWPPGWSTWILESEPLEVGHSCGFGCLGGSGGHSGGQQSFVVDVSLPGRPSVSLPVVVMYRDREECIFLSTSFGGQLLMKHATCSSQLLLCAIIRALRNPRRIALTYRLSV